MRQALGPSQLRLLAYIKDKDEVSPIEVAKELAMSHQNVNTCMKSLLTRGYVKVARTNFIPRGAVYRSIYKWTGKPFEVDNTPSEPDVDTGLLMQCFNAMVRCPVAESL